MRKRTYFESRRSQGWPESVALERYFFAPIGQRWFETGNDSAGFTAEGVEGTEQFELGKGRIDIHLVMNAHPAHGVLLTYMKQGGGINVSYYSRKDLGRLREWVYSTHGTPFPVGLFIPFEEAWKAVKEFIETDGALPRSIDWVVEYELPSGTFPDLGREG
jgi:hypothetical protein